MERIQLLKELLDMKKSNSVHTKKIQYKVFLENLDVFKKLFGNNAVLMFSNDTAVICFKYFENLRFIIKKSNGNSTEFSKEDFNISLNLSIIGSNQNKSDKIGYLLKNDIKDNKRTIIIVGILYFGVFNSFGLNFNSLVKLNDSLLVIISIFIASFFVFIGLFYNDKSKTIESFKKGLFDKYHKIDQYIFKLSLLGILFDLLSTGVIYFKCNNSMIKNFILTYINYSAYQYIKFNIAFMLTYLSSILLIICLDSILNFYLSRIRNNYFIDAFEEVVQEFKNKK